MAYADNQYFPRLVQTTRLKGLSRERFTYKAPAAPGKTASGALRLATEEQDTYGIVSYGYDRPRWLVSGTTARRAFSPRRS